MTKADFFFLGRCRRSAAAKRALDGAPWSRCGKVGLVQAGPWVLLSQALGWRGGAGVDQARPPPCLAVSEDLLHGLARRRSSRAGRRRRGRRSVGPARWRSCWPAEGWPLSSSASICAEGDCRGRRFLALLAVVDRDVHAVLDAEAGWREPGSPVAGASTPITTVVPRAAALPSSVFLPSSLRGAAKR